MPDPPLGASYREGELPKENKNARGDGFRGYRYLIPRQIEDEKYVDSGTIEFSTLARYGRVVVVSTTESAENTPDLRAVSASETAAFNNLYDRVWAVVSRER